MKSTLLKATRRTSGFTLVELMVAMVIGLVLTLVVAQLFIGSRRTFATTDDSSRMQENTRFANQLMARIIHQAGYRSSPNTQADFVFSVNAVIAGNEGASALVPDDITVAFQGSGAGTGDGSVINCRGERVGAGIMSTNKFSIANVTTTVGGVSVTVPSLVCTTDTAPNTPQVIVADVDNMKILYGEDTDGDATADRFVTKGGVGNMKGVVAVRIALLLRSPNANIERSITPDNPYTLNGITIPKDTYQDARIRRDTVFTIGIRNRSL